MENTARRIFCVAILAAFTTMWSVNASAGGYLEPGKVKSMQSAYGGWLIATEGAVVNPDSCSQGGLAILEPSHAQYDELYSLVLSAYMAEKKIRLYVSGCHTAGGYMKVLFVTVNNTW